MAKHELDHLRVTKGEKGGHVVEHHFTGSVTGSYTPPEIHVFGKGEGGKMLKHISRHMAVQESASAYKKGDADGDE